MLDQPHDPVVREAPADSGDTCRITLQDPAGYEWSCSRDTHGDEVPHAATQAFESVFGPIFGVFVWRVAPSAEDVRNVTGAFGTPSPVG